MNEYRVTKYDPALRDSSGAYTRDEWTSVSDIGRSFGGVVLTREAYRRVEDAYFEAALAFLREAAVATLTVRGLEGSGDSEVREGEVLTLDQAGELLRRLLREELWCRLEGESSFLHVGYDYYMYIGVPRPCPAAQALARRLGLHVEPFQSPYREDADEEGA